MEAGVIVLTAFISPYSAARKRVRDMVEPNDFIEIYCDAPIEICESRDRKGFYRKARDGEIAEFTGISASYEAPATPDLTVHTGSACLDACVEQVIKKIVSCGICALQFDPVLESEAQKYREGSGS